MRSVAENNNELRFAVEQWCTLLVSERRGCDCGSCTTSPDRWMVHVHDRLCVQSEPSGDVVVDSQCVDGHEAIEPTRLSCLLLGRLLQSGPRPVAPIRRGKRLQNECSRVEHKHTYTHAPLSRRTRRAHTHCSITRALSREGARAVPQSPYFLRDLLQTTDKRHVSCIDTCRAHQQTSLARTWTAAPLAAWAPS